MYKSDRSRVRISLLPYAEPSSPCLTKSAGIPPICPRGASSRDAGGLVRQCRPGRAPRARARAPPLGMVKSWYISTHVVHSGASQCPGWQLPFRYVRLIDSNDLWDYMRISQCNSDCRRGGGGARGRRPEEAARHPHQHLSAGQWSRGWGFNARLAGQMVVSGAVEAGFRGGRGSGSVWWVGFEAHATSRAAA